MEIALVSYHAHLDRQLFPLRSKLLKTDGGPGRSVIPSMGVPLV
jgi:hypothetical protein